MPIVVGVGAGQHVMPLQELMQQDAVDESTQSHAKDDAGKRDALRLWCASSWWRCQPCRRLRSEFVSDAYPGGCGVTSRWGCPFWQVMARYLTGVGYIRQ